MTEKTTGIVWTTSYLEHDTGEGHPERADRLRAIYDRMQSTGLLDRSQIVIPQAADLSLLERVHASDYIDRFRRSCQHHQRLMDSADCAICDASFDIAQLAAGGVVAAIDEVMSGRIRNAFCPVRPPGHHAEYRAAMGFCYFNNIAVGAEHLRVGHGVNRVAILDWDVHHGNGTQHQFEADPEVLFISLHQHPQTLFPGTGFDWEVGYGEARDATMNLPMLPGTTDDAYRAAFEKQVLPAITAFQPEFLLVSAGFDAHVRDPLAQINLSTEMFAWMTRQVRALAQSLCQGRLVSVLEGGYELDSLADCVQAHLEALGERPGTEPAAAIKLPGKG